MKHSSQSIIKSAKTIFFDFDGVIKESVEVKSVGFQDLFKSYGKKLTEKIRLHHNKHPGMSRYEKIPLYLSWAGEKVNDKNTQIYCDKFSLIVKQSVINSRWVPGIQDFLETHYKKKKFIIITATPSDEIKEILSELKIDHFFVEVYGSPTSKINALNFSINSQKIDTNDALFIGDSRSDYNAATSASILFLLRKTDINYSLQKTLKVSLISDFVTY